MKKYRNPLTSDFEIAFPEGKIGHVVHYILSMEIIFGASWSKGLVYLRDGLVSAADVEDEEEEVVSGGLVGAS